MTERKSLLHGDGWVVDRERAVIADAERDRALLAAVTNGSQSALAELYDHYAPQMLGVACRIVGNQRDGEDLLHDVFMEVWEKARSFDSNRGTVRNWLFLRVRSRAIDRIRALATARKYAMAERPPELSETSSQTDPSQQLDCIRAREAMSSLSESQREVVTLGYFEGLTCQEIAERCQVPVGTVKSRLAAARAALRTQFSNAQPGESR